jgi:hypothetical protein
MRLAGAALFLAVGCSLSAQPASIAGIVIDRTTGKPIAQVHVVLIDPQKPEYYGAVSDSTGHFSVGNMPPGRYSIDADRTGYVLMTEQSVSLKEGQPIADVIVKMARASMLAGRVVDQYGDPASRMRVRVVAVRPAKVSAPDGEYMQTDDRGEFRILTGPGKYYLDAEPEQVPHNGPPEVRTDGSSETVYGLTYYPNTPVKTRASAVEVIAGRDLEGLEIHLTAAVSQRLFSVSGTVRGVPGDGPVAVFLTGADGQEVHVPAWVRGDGSFSVSGLLPSTYVATARTFQPNKLLVARTAFKIEAADVNGVELVLREPGEVTGTLRIVGGTPAAGEKRKVLLESDGGGSPMFDRSDVSGDVNADGTFHLANVWPDRFFVSVDPLPDTAYVKSMELDGEAVTDSRIEVWGGHVPRLKITVALDGASISGKISARDGEEPAGAAVLLFASPKEVNLAYPGEDNYIFKGVRPGKYRLIAAQVDDDTDKEKLFAAAEEIEVRPGDRITKDLTYAPRQ